MVCKIKHLFTEGEVWLFASLGVSPHTAGSIIHSSLITLLNKSMLRMCNFQQNHVNLNPRLIWLAKPR